MSFPHNYNTRQNSVAVNDNGPTSSETPNFSELIISLEGKLLTPFHEVDKKLLNLKDIIIKDLQIENQRLQDKVINLEKRVILLEVGGNLLEQYGPRNNLEMTGIPDDVEDEDLEEKIIKILDKIEVNVKSKDIEACHRVGKSRSNSRKTIICFVNRKFAKKALINRKSLKNIDKSSIALSNSSDIFINENLTPTNSKLTFHCRKLKREGFVDRNFSRDGVVCITSKNVQNRKTIKVLHFNTMVDLFPNFDFGEVNPSDDHNVFQYSQVIECKY